MDPHGRLQGGPADPRLAALPTGRRATCEHKVLGLETQIPALARSSPLREELGSPASVGQWSGEPGGAVSGQLGGEPG